jgi:hypothetical protein
MKRLIFLLLFAGIANADVIKNDTFTVGSDTALESHTSDSGGAWVNANSTGITVSASLDAAINESASTRTPTGDEDPTETDYFVEVTGTLGGTAVSDNIGVVVRGNHDPSTGTSANSDYYDFIIRGSDGWFLRRCIAGACGTAILDSDNSYTGDNSIGAATVVKVKLEVTGTGATVNLKGYIDPDGGGYDLVTNFDDTNAARIVAAGNVGFEIRGVNAAITEFNAEDFQAGAEYDTAPTVTAQSTTAYTVTGSLDGAGTVHGVACHKDQTAPTIAQVQAGDCTGDVDAEAADTDSPSTGDFDFSLTLTPTTAYPVFDIYVTDGTTLTTLADEFLDPPSTCGLGSDELCEFTSISSIGTGSPCEDFNTAAAPDIASPDILISPVNVSPGDYALTISAACQFSYDDSGEGAQQRAFNIAIYDVSAEDYHAEDIDFMANNTGPTNIQTLGDPIVYDEDEAIDTLEVCSGFDDPDLLDQIEITVTGGILPNGLSLDGTGNCDLDGTPDTEDEGGETVTFTATDDAGETDTLDITFYVVNTVTMPTLTGGTLDAANTAIQTAFPWLDEISYTTILRCHPAANDEIYAQDPAASAEVDPFPDISLNVSSKRLCAAIRRRL